MLSASDQASAYLGEMKKKSNEKMLTILARTEVRTLERSERKTIQQMNHRQIGEVTVRPNELGSQTAEHHAAHRQPIGAESAVQRRQLCDHSRAGGGGINFASIFS